ncbi:MAG: type II toxin-antitoxin system RelE/ParE family toxin [Chloroflexi bacterium]|nr:type II toxin-antitoxin system RelE/ParE family toxin [Chloroflexota bacterium]
MYRLHIERTAKKDLDRLAEDEFQRVSRAMESLLQNPRPKGSIKLTGREGYRLRVGDYRVLYRINDKDQTVVVRGIKHRREAYR